MLMKNNAQKICDADRFALIYKIVLSYWEQHFPWIYCKKRLRNTELL